MKKPLALLLAAVLLLSLCACSSAPTDETTVDPQETETNTVIRLYAMTGPTGMGLASLLHNDDVKNGNRADYEYELVSAPDLARDAIISQSCDIAAVPINLAATLYAKTNGQIQILCANTLGVLHIVENGSTVNSVEDLRGKTIYAPNPGSTPEYILRFVLKENGIDPDNDVTLEFLQGGDEVAAKLALTEGAIGMLPEPKLSAFLSSSPDFRVALDMTEEWNKIAGEDNTLVQGVFVARKEFVEAHPDLIRAFLDDYNDSQALINRDHELGAQYIVDAQIIPKVPLAKKAIPGSNIVFLEKEAMKNAVSKCLQVLYEADSKSVGGTLPDDGIFYAG